MLRVVTKTTDSGTGSLRDIITQAQDGDVIVFRVPRNSRITLNSGQIDIPAGKDLTIDGRGVANLSISGNRRSRIFNLNSTAGKPTSLTLKNLTLADGKTRERGGAITTTGELSNLTIENVVFNNNVAAGGGGAINSVYRGTLTIIDSEFHRNNGTARNQEEAGGAITFIGPNTLTVKDSEFIENRGINGGAIYNVHGKILIENSRFIDNSTTDAYYARGARNPFLRGHGGAIQSDGATLPGGRNGYIKIINSVFEGNRAEGQGGAANLYTRAGDEVIIEGCTFNDNQVTPQPNGSPGNGGAVMQVSNVVNRGFTIKNSTFSNNSATNQGGAVWKNYARTNITNSTFSGNRVENPTELNNPRVVGGALTLYGSANITNVTFAENHAAWVAGAIASDSNNIRVKNTIFYNNTAANGGNDWSIKHTTNYQLRSGGNNIQYPDLQSNRWNRWNDVYAVANITVANPMIAPLRDNGGLTKTHALLRGSPAIDAGTNTGAPTIDQRGNSRPLDGNADGISIIDIGAFEVVTQTRQSYDLDNDIVNNFLVGSFTHDNLVNSTIQQEPENLSTPEIPSVEMAHFTLTPPMDNLNNTYFDSNVIQDLVPPL